MTPWWSWAFAVFHVSVAVINLYGMVRIHQLHRRTKVTVGELAALQARRGPDDGSRVQVEIGGVHHELCRECSFVMITAALNEQQLPQPRPH